MRKQHDKERVAIEVKKQESKDRLAHPSRIVPSSQTYLNPDTLQQTLDSRFSQVIQYVAGARFTAYDERS
jgi:hypothetical protein